MAFLTAVVMAVLVVGASAINASVSDGNHPPSYCIVFSADVSGIITYETHQNATKTYEFKVPVLTESSGKCLSATNGSTTETLELKFYPNNVTPNVTAADPWTLTIVFKETPEQSNNAYTVDTYSLDTILYEDVFVNATQEKFTFEKASTAEVEWAGEKTVGFKCSKSGLPLAHDSLVSFENLKVVALGHLDKPDFGPNQGFELCKLDIRTSDVVPIVVGACLAGLVIIVLIAYLIGRARARRQGYASV